MDDSAQTGSNEEDFLAAVGTCGIRSPPLHHAVQAKLVLALQDAVLADVVIEADCAFVGHRFRDS